MIFFALTAKREHEYRIDPRYVAVQRNVTIGPRTDDEFALAAAHGSPDMRTVNKHVECVDQGVDARLHTCGLMLPEMVNKTIEVVQGPVRKLQNGHDLDSQRFLATGRTVC